MKMMTYACWYMLLNISTLDITEVEVIHCAEGSKLMGGSLGTPKHGICVILLEFTRLVNPTQPKGGVSLDFIQNVFALFFRTG